MQNFLVLKSEEKKDFTTYILEYSVPNDIKTNLQANKK